MNRAHGRFLELAAASIDFDLSARERAELGAHLAGCLSCSRKLDRLRADARTMRELPVRALALERVPFVVGRALGRRRPDLRPLRLALIAVAIGLLLLGLAIAGTELLRRDLSTLTPSPAASDAPLGPSSLPPSSPASVGWEPAETLSEPRTGHTAVVFGDGRVLVMGGTAVIEIYDPATQQWGTTVDSAVADRFGTRVQAMGLALADGSAFFVGGFGSGGAVAETDRFPQQRSWEPGPTLLEPRGRAGVVQLADGGVLVAGGTNTEFLASAELISLDTGDAAFTGSLAAPRHNPTATRLPDGRVLLVGGAHDEGSTTETAEIYDPSTGQWSPAASMRDARSNHTATLLPDGRVLIAGGMPDGSNPWSSAEIYDPAADSWSVVGEMRDPRSGHGAALRSDGRVLVVGGWRGGGQGGLASTELFDPATSTWADGPDLATARSEVVLVVLLDGSILVIGGSAEDAATAEVEVLRPAPTASEGT